MLQTDAPETAGSSTSTALAGGPLRAKDPTTIGSYRLLSRLGVGGTADVFYAIAPTGVPVALKLHRAAEGAMQACRREFTLASAVDAYCTAPVIGHGVSPAGAYLVTTYLPGYQCGSVALGRSRPASRVWALASGLATVLAAVHARGIVHCDVKPSNLLMRDADVRVIDFGIARYVGESRGDDRVVECSWGWAAPEQLRGVPATPAVDVFAWGCVVAYLAGGVSPFDSQSLQEWVLRVHSTEPDLYGLPPDLGEVVHLALAREPRNRPGAHELARMCRDHADAPAQI